MSQLIKNRSLARQAGYGLLEWILIVMTLAFFLLLGFRLIPLYTENQYVVAALKDLVKVDEKLEEMTDKEIIKRMENFYMVNNVRSDGPTKIKIDRYEDDRVIVTVDYRAKASLVEDQPLVGTIELVVPFKNHLDSKFPRECCKPIKD